MNYKILLLFALLMSSSFILGSSRALKSNRWSMMASASPAQNLAGTTDPFTWTDDQWLLSHLQVADHDSEDDGKFIHIHFTRLQRRRKRYLYCGLSKGAIALAHAASLLYSLVHIIHY